GVRVQFRYPWGLPSGTGPVMPLIHWKQHKPHPALDLTRSGFCRQASISTTAFCQVTRRRTPTIRFLFGVPTMLILDFRLAAKIGEETMVRVRMQISKATKLAQLVFILGVVLGVAVSRLAAQTGAPNAVANPPFSLSISALADKVKTG